MLRDARIEKLVIARASGLTAEQAAKSAGCSVRTAERYCADPAFKARVVAARKEMTDRAVGLIARMNTQAAATLGSLFLSPNDSVRLGAVRLALEIAANSVIAGELEERIAGLEQRLAAQEGANK